MPEEDFLGALKMISGEEVLSRVTSINDENGHYLVLESPILVEEVTVADRVGAKVSPWMKFSKERSFIVPMDRVITVVEVDAEVEAFYEMSIQKIDPEKEKTPPRNQGRVGSVEESRAILESIFKRNNKWS
tara:strand:+ start:55 stop:447 length:393 start_codon:yes stop_codon:yes gene_type:complete